jgi:aromatic ring-opening dioxygenase catalytic subunit (LigB family)
VHYLRTTEAEFILMTTPAGTAHSTILYIPHGGGPLPLLGDPGHKGMVEFLGRVTREFERPSAIVIISAHWEEETVTITSGARPPLFYDYYGFPDESYRITYPAPGDPPLAQEISGLLKVGGIESRMDEKRGFDHGVFVPLKLMYPDAQIPCVQVSLVRGLDPQTHLRIGKALAALRAKDILILGSGFSFHHLSAFFSSRPEAPDPRNEAFQDWLIATCSAAGPTQQDREKKLIGWDEAPGARYCHPREEHLLPLHVCAGMAGTPARVVFDGKVLGKRSIGLLWD